MINDRDYWNKKFDNSSDAEQRAVQTEYFVRLALDNLPRWCTESISDSSKTLCDMGCAGGEGTELLRRAFPNCKVIGADFSESAIRKANMHGSKDITFVQADIRSFSERYDVIFSSNVIEHFYDAKGMLKHLLSKANQYLILLLPFREYYRIAEHETTFDFQSFPMREGEHVLSYFKIIPMSSDEDKEFWYGEQILVVYKKTHVELPYGDTLETMYNGYMEERTHIIAEYDQKLSDQKMLLTKKEDELKESKAAIANGELELFRQRKLLEESRQELAESNEQIERNRIEIEEKKRELEQRDREIEECTRDLNLSHQKLREEESEVDRLYKELADANSALEKANEELNDLRDSYQVCALQCDKNENVIRQVREAILTTQLSRSYKWSLLLRRFLHQVCRGDRAERRDFVCWLWGKITRKESQAKWLCEFDYLDGATTMLQGLQLPENRINIEGKELLCDRTEISCDKNGRQVFIFASVPFYDVGGGQRSAQLAKTYSEMGLRVYYIYGFDSSESKRENIFIPTLKHVHIDQYSVEEMRQDIQNDALLIFEIPYTKFMPYLDYACKRGIETVYEHIDNWESSLGSLFYDEQVFRSFVKKSGVITVTAKLLGEKISAVWNRNYLYLANAVNSTIFEPTKDYQKPSDLVEGKKTLLYFGSLWGEWFDWEKIVYVARHCDCEINLIGDYYPIVDRIKTMPANIHFLGLKKQTELPAYLCHSDIALLPFKNCEIGKYVSPLKIFEYIAMNKPVVATPLDDIEGYPNVITADSNQEWAAAVEKHWELKETSTFISQNNWFARCGALLKYSDAEKQRIPKVSVIVLNHNNRNVISRCVSSLLAFNGRYECEIIVVDNDSTDGSYEMLCEEYGNRIALIKNAKNGCSSGRNLGAKYAKGEMLFFLDSDQWIVGENYLDNALDILHRYDSIGAVGWNAGWFNPGRYDGPIVDYLPNRGMDDPSKLFRTDIAYLATSGMLMRKKLFVEIDGFDEFYDPTCFEDTDISLRIRHAGFELAYCPYMEIMHLPHQTTNSGSKKHSQLMERNGAYFLKKWRDIDASLLEYYL